MSQRGVPAEVRFWNHVSKSDGCWEWTGGRSRGYGRFKPVSGGSPVRAHRFMWEMTHGPIPTGGVVCHRCDNPACVRPEHLFLGTQDDNNRDKVNKGRQGAGCRMRSRAKLTVDDVREIRERYAAGGVTMTELAKVYGIDRTGISRAINSRYWKDVTSA